jgi:hypothetical protein
MIWEGHVAHVTLMTNAYTILAGKTEGKKPVGRYRHGWKDNIKIVL